MRQFDSRALPPCPCNVYKHCRGIGSTGGWLPPFSAAELSDRNSALSSSHTWYAGSAMRDSRQWPAPWLFGMLVLPLGIYVGFTWTALPLLLSQAGFTIGQIARLNAILQVPPILLFL
jgi:hypothetical protein